jgi:hypothetical protein
MTEQEFIKQVEMGQRLVTQNDPLSQMLGALTFERLRQFISQNTETHLLEALLPRGYQRIPKRNS